MVSTFKNFSAIWDQMPPHNIEAEESVLGSILLDPQAIEVVANILPNAQAFYVLAHRIIYNACLALRESGKSVDLITVIGHLNDKKKLEEVGGQLKLVQLLDRVTGSGLVDLHAKLILEKWTRRKIIELGHGLIEAGFNTIQETPDLLDQLQEEVDSFKATTAKQSEFEAVEIKYNQMIAEFKRIEMSVADPGLRSYLIQNLANKYKRSERQLETMFFKYLVGKENEPIRYLDQLREEFGDSTNEWFLHGFIPKGSVVLLHAAGGLGKSRLTYEFAYHLASGTPWNQFHVTAPRRKVMLIQTDEQTKDTLRAIGDRWPAGNADRYIAHKSKWNMEHVASLRQEILEHKIDVVIVDSLTSVNKHNIFSENETEYARPILLLKEMAEELGCTFIVVHHSNKEGKSRGTGAIFNSVSLVLSLQLPSEGSTRESPNRFLCIEKSRFHRPTKYALRYEIDEETHQWTWVCDGEDTKQVDTNLPTKPRILDFLASNRNVAYSAIAIHEFIGGTQGDVRRCCYQLSNDGAIGRKQTKGSSHAWLYFLNWEDGSPIAPELRSDAISDKIGGCNSYPASNLEVADRDRAKIGSSGLSNLGAKNSDLRSATERSNLQTIDISTTEVKKSADRSSDLSDPIAIDNLNGARRTDGELNGEQNEQKPLQKKDSVADRNLQNSQNGSFASVDRKPQYKYVGTDSALIKLCANKPYLEILELKGKTAIVSTPGWKQPHRIPMAHLSLIGNRVDDSIYLGDRVFDKVRAYKGTVTKIEGETVYFEWESGKAHQWIHAIQRIK
jgi:KaiC/GvpD/RAD55 family RecA-like ATPase